MHTQIDNDGRAVLLRWRCSCEGETVTGKHGEASVTTLDLAGSSSPTVP